MYQYIKFNLFRKCKRRLGLFAVLTFLATAVNGQLVINEVMSSNESFFQNDRGEYPDWVEIHNAGQDAMNLQGYGLSDRRSDIKYRFPNTMLAPKAFMVVFASEGPGELEASFKLSKEGETVFLFNTTDELVDSMQVAPLEDDQSFGRLCDSLAVYGHFNEPTFSASNCDSDIQFIGGPVSFSKKGGYYPEAFDLSLECPLPEAEVRFTLDHSDPDANSQLYQAPLTLQSRPDEQYYYANIKTSSAISIDTVYAPQPKATVVRAACFVDGKRQGDVVTHTYFIERLPHDLPIVSLVSAEKHFFSRKSGIMVPGNPKGGYNYEQKGRAWERPVSFEYFIDGELQLARNAGVRIHGGTTRGLPLKSLRLYAREDYGFDNFHFPFFPDREEDKYKRLLLRNAGQDYWGAFLRDALAHEILKGTTLDIQANQPVVVYLNGEYWGLANMREYQDDHYVESHYGIDSRTVKRYKYQSNELIQFARKNDMKDSVIYQQMKEMMDVRNYQDLVIADNYFYRWDNNNRELWDSPGRPKRFFLFDMDVGLGGASTQEQPWLFDYFKYMDDPTNELGERDIHEDYNHPFSYVYLSLMENDSFQTQFLERYLDLLKTNFSYPNTRGLARRMASRIEDEMINHIERWGQFPGIDYWFWHLDYIDDFLRMRPCAVYDQLVERFGVFDETLDRETCEELDPLDVPHEIESVVFPNPTDGPLTIQFEKQVSGSFRLINAQGQILDEIPLENTNQFSMDISHYPPGLYYILVTGSDRYFMKVRKL